jgi:hypothetical protein
MHDAAQSSASAARAVIKKCTFLFVVSIVPLGASRSSVYQPVSIVASACSTGGISVLAASCAASVTSTPAPDANLIFTAIVATSVAMIKSQAKVIFAARVFVEVTTALAKVMAASCAVIKQRALAVRSKSFAALLSHTYQTTS